MAERESASAADLSNAALYMAALILNETVNAVSEYSGDKEILIEAIQDTVGRAEAPAYYYEKYGAETLFAALDELYDDTGFGSYRHGDMAAWEAVLKQPKR